MGEVKIQGGGFPPPPIHRLNGITREGAGNSTIQTHEHMNQKMKEENCKQTDIQHVITKISLSDHVIPTYTQGRHENTNLQTVKQMIIYLLEEIKATFRKFKRNK